MTPLSPPLADIARDVAARAAVEIAALSAIAVAEDVETRAMLREAGRELLRRGGSGETETRA